MTRQYRFFILLLMLIPSLAIAQQKDTLVKKLDSLAKQTDSVGGKQKNDISERAYEHAKITSRTYVILTASDMKQQLTSPFRATRTNWVEIGAFGLVTTGCVLFVDKPVNRLGVDIRNNSKSVVSISSYVTRFGGAYEGYTLAAFAAYGLIFKKEKPKTTTILATQAYITAAAIETALKFLTGRQRPSYYDPLTNKNDNVFHGPFYQFKKDKNGVKPPATTFSSFPSGHTTVVFAAATVFAMEYKNSKFVPILAYSAASLVGLSRITENQHWASDVLVGAALGYLCGRQVVNNYHRYSKLKSEAAKKKGTLSFNLNYFNGTLLPGCVYTFR